MPKMEINSVSQIRFWTRESDLAHRRLDDLWFKKNLTSHVHDFYYILLE